MIETKECPLCAETMHLKKREEVSHIPGMSQVVRREIREWNCADCDYFEEYEESVDEPPEPT